MATETTMQQLNGLRFKSRGRRNLRHTAKITLLVIRETLRA